MKKTTKKGGATCLLVANTFPPLTGGSSFVYSSLAQSASGKIIILTGRLDYRTGNPFQTYPKFSFPVIRIPLVRPLLGAAPPRGAWSRRIKNFWVKCNLLYAVSRVVNKYGIPCVCIADDETVGWLVPYVRYFLRRSTIIYCHGDDLTEAKARSSLRKTWFLFSDAIVAASEFAKKCLIERFGVDEDKITVISNGVDVRHFRVQKASPTLITRYGLEGRRIIMSVSRLVPRKGIDRVIESLPFLIRRHPDIIYLIIGDGDDRRRLERKVEALKVHDAVRFLGAISHDELPEHYSLAEIVALPNRIEHGEEDGLPLVFLEANACGRPVIGGNAGGTSEVVYDGDNGFLVNGNDHQEISERIDDLLSDNNLYLKIQNGALTKAASEDWRNKAQLFLKLCERLER